MKKNAKKEKRKYFKMPHQQILSRHLGATLDTYVAVV